MTRKRKSASVPSIMKRPVLPVLRTLGNAVNHPLMVVDKDIKESKTGAKSMDVMKMVCFAGIPACCLSARGSGPNSGIAEESAAHAMLDFFRCVVSTSDIENLFSIDLTAVHLQPFQLVFEAFEIKIKDKSTLMDRCGQYETTSAALVRGKEVKKQIVKQLNENRKKSVSHDIPRPAALFEDDDDVVIIEDTRKIADHHSARCLDDILVLNESQMSSDQSNAIQEMRKTDSAIRQEAGDRLARQMTMRRSKLGSRVHEVDFGPINRSGQGPSDVFCCVPNSSFVTSFSEDLSSDSEDEVSRKRMKLASNADNVVVHVTSANPSELTKESDGELGDIFDEWNEIDDERERNSEYTLQSGKATNSTPETKKKNVIYDGNTTLDYFLGERMLPRQYQSRTIGVIVNEPLARSVASYVAEVSSHSLESVIKLSKLAWDHYFNNNQPESVYDRKMQARQLLFNEMQKVFHDKHVSLQVTGSTVNGCGSYNSDVDMCLCYPTNGKQGKNFNDFDCDRSFSLRVLRKIEKTFKRLPQGHQFKKVVNYCNLIPAKVPIIKLLLNGIYSGMEIDINVNNIAGIYNSHLTHYYSLTDARFPALSLIVKHWAMRAGINNSPDGFLNSYTLVLMVLHFLQCGVKPAVLPNLQYLFPDKFDRKLPLTELILFGEIAQKLPAAPPNTSSIGELIIGFFNYYSQFDFDKSAISIRSAQALSRDCLPWDTKKFPLFVEEPFDAINTARSVRTSSHMNTIKSAFRAASEVFLHEHFEICDLGVEVVSRDGTTK